MKKVRLGNVREDKVTDPVMAKEGKDAEEGTKCRVIVCGKGVKRGHDDGGGGAEGSAEGSAEGNAEGDAAGGEESVDRALGFSN